METNLDWQILLNKRVDLNSNISVEEQVLRIAIYDEFHAYETYSAIIAQYGSIEPFVSVKEAEARHYSALMPLLEKYNVAVPINDWALKIEVPATYIECCELGVAGELSNIRMYDDLIANTTQTDIKDVLFKLQAASFNRHLPIFRNCVQSYYNQQNETGFNSEDMMNKVQEYQLLLEDLATGNMDQEKLTGLLSKMNISMISGAALGSAGIAFLNAYTNKIKE